MGETALTEDDKLNNVGVACRFFPMWRPYAEGISTPSYEIGLRNHLTIVILIVPLGGMAFHLR
jgi:hypothetical protein